MEPGLILMVVIVALFYLRLYLLRRGRRRRDRLETLDRMKQGKKGTPVPDRNPNTPGYRVTSWWILVPGILLLLLGLAINSEAFLADYRAYWWIPSVIGGILFIFSFE